MRPGQGIDYCYAQDECGRIISVGMPEHARRPNGQIQSPIKRDYIRAGSGPVVEEGDCP